MAFDEDGAGVADREALRRLVELANEAAGEIALVGEAVEAGALESVGRLRFELREGEALARVIGEYEAKRALSEGERRWLREFTAARWEDGVGDGVVGEGDALEGYEIQALSGEEVGEETYPFVEVLE